MAIAAPVAAQQKSVAITAIVEHPALDAVRDGVQDALKQAGYEAGKNLKWQYQSAQGNNGTAAQIARNRRGRHEGRAGGVFRRDRSRCRPAGCRHGRLGHQRDRRVGPAGPGQAG
ncbi:hypothetical protein G6F22_020992 [Rhizopus arrhizus]|nr:hypothetical protein G6F22_020992 [Rhizopus arrhizus]